MSDYTMPVNIGNPEEITIREFAEEIIKLTGTQQKIVYKPLPRTTLNNASPTSAWQRKFWDGNPRLPAQRDYGLPTNISAAYQKKYCMNGSTGILKNTSTKFNG